VGHDLDGDRANRHALPFGGSKDGLQPLFDVADVAGVEDLLDEAL
jgi:hypothetical protein